MKANVGSSDSGLRFVTGCVLLIAANRGHGSWLAGVALIASAIGFCPLYWLLGLETGRCERADRRRPGVGPPSSGRPTAAAPRSDSARTPATPG